MCQPFLEDINGAQHFDLRLICLQSGRKARDIGGLPIIQALIHDHIGGLILL
jgi:hypothetical protein